jgi:hypothetical protein
MYIVSRFLRLPHLTYHLCRNGCHRDIPMAQTSFADVTGTFHPWEACERGGYPRYAVHAR